MSTREYDIIVWGATGFTGQLVAEYLSANAPKEIKFAIGGRSRAKLESVAAACLVAGKHRFKDMLVPIEIADSGDQHSIDELVSKTKVIISTVGPYARYGWTLVDACVRLKTDYLDLTAEPNFIRPIVEKYHEKAKENGVYICHSSGFDSLPSDLGAFLIANKFKSMGLETDNIRLSVIEMTGGVSGGTLASGMGIIEDMGLKQTLKFQDNPDYFIPQITTINSKAWKGTTLYYDKGLKTWQMPFFMESANLRNVRRSAWLNGYGSNFNYREGMAVSNPVFGAIAVVVFGMVALLAFFPPFRWLVGKVLPPGEGPSEDVRNSGFFHLQLFGEAKDSTTTFTTKCTIKCQGDPGYKATSMMISESAINLALNKQKLITEKNGNFLPQRGGVVTPATSGGMLLVERLKKTGFTFQLE